MKTTLLPQIDKEFRQNHLKRAKFSAYPYIIETIAWLIADAWYKDHKMIA
ncbi:hypothetical protein [Larkinella sp. C7]|nr:hypothetical protein [Larkinella sp. C7]